MKTIKFVLLSTLLALLAGCSVMPPTISDHGVQIRGKRTVEIKIHNNSSESILVELKTTSLDFRADYHLVKSKEVKMFLTKVDWEGTIKIRHRDESATDFLGDTLYEKSFRTGLVEDQDIHIDDLALKGRAQRRGYIINMGDPTMAILDDGRSFALNTGQSMIIYRASGPIHITLSPLHDPRNKHRTRILDGTVPNSRKNWEHHPSDGSPMQLMDFRIRINEHWQTNW